ncbi:hypothetical protein CCR75_008628 [Bremia lactucae]|uniref:Rab3 GTPase-activating protein catalytic subunit n=1 Tax=Bremia lactucae TaxID=4779 RepID=A0A976FI27_BRELC|nr:hypothetical protein CCR75_008628 [Bremia lactucae]
MTTSADNETWDEWEVDGTVSSATLPLRSLNDATEAKIQLPTDSFNISPFDTEKWRFDLSELEQEMSSLTPAAYVTPLSRSCFSTNSEERLIAALEWLPPVLRSARDRMQTLEALALVARLHVVAARSSFPELHSNTQTTKEQVLNMTQELKQLAGVWGDRALLASTPMASARQQFEEMIKVLHHALDDETVDLTLFQEIFEQLFESLPEQKLVVSTNWLTEEKVEMEEKEMHSYVDHVLAICRDTAINTSRMPTLSEADILQDAKDITRDELLINGEHIAGKKGYDAVVDALQRELELILARQVGKVPEETPMAVSNALQSVAMAVLHASNRTESGGSSYELLAKLLSTHTSDRVLLRPASARAAPLQVQMDVGPYIESVPGCTYETWAFGLRIQLIAVTWYLVCDAFDPCKELYEMETTFCNRLAFPVGLTPFHPLDSMRKDPGTVTIRMKPSPASVSITNDSD